MKPYFLTTYSNKNNEAIRINLNHVVSYRSLKPEVLEIHTITGVVFTIKSGWDSFNYDIEELLNKDA